MKILVLSDLHLELGTSLTATRIPGSITWGAGAEWSAPPGDRLRDPSFENSVFDPALVIELASHTTLPPDHAA